MLQVDPHSLSFCLVVSKPLIYTTIPCHKWSHCDPVIGVHLFPATVEFLGLV